MKPGSKPFARGARRGRDPVRLPAARRRYGRDAGPADDLDHGVRARCRRAKWSAAAAPARRPRRGHGHDRRRRAGPRCSARAARWRRRSRTMPRRRPCWSDATGCRSRATPWPPRARSRRARRWTCRMVSPAISPSFARRPACPPTIDSTSVPLSAAARARCSRAARSASKRSSPAATITRFCAPFRENRVAAFASAAAAADVAVTTIGTIIAGAGRPRFLDAQGREIALPRAVLQPFLAFRDGAKRVGLPQIPCRNRRFRRSAALRPGCDFGMVPPIWGRPFGQGRPPFYAPAASRGDGVGLHQDLRQIQ